MAGITSGSLGVGVTGVALATSGDAAGVEGDSYSGAGGTFHNYGGGIVIRGGNATGDVFTVDSSGNTSIGGGLVLSGSLSAASGQNTVAATLWCRAALA